MDGGKVGDDWSGSDLDFTVAHGFKNPEKIRRLRDYFLNRPGEVVETSRAAINEVVNDQWKLSKSEAESLFTGLVLAGVATERGGGTTFADYIFEVECAPASKVLDTQRIGREAMNTVCRQRSQENEVVLTATFPPGVQPSTGSLIRPLSSDIRQLFFDADSTVRIANPYFDASETVIGDIASLANRGVRTKILTRETGSDNGRLSSTLNSIHEQISPGKRELLEVRDLYQEDSRTGRQSYATHAKIVIADDSPCYVGSANLTEMNLSNNFEFGVLLSGEMVDEAITVFDTVFNSAISVKLPI